jgi:regulator of protease activity HflC (stomatin/prohibitin superfamily)
MSAVERSGWRWSTVQNSPRISRLALIVLALGYWLFAWQLERIDFSLTPPLLWRQILELYPLFDVVTPYLLIPAEFLSPRVLRHFIPVVVGWWLARQATVRWLESFHGLADAGEAASILRRLVSPSSATGSATPVRPGQFDADREAVAIFRVGGPGKLSIPAGNAIVTEVNGRFSRVLGPGSQRLGAFEYPYSLVDVRPHERQMDDARMVTADGIEVSAKLDVTFQIDRGGREPSRDEPFPFEPDAVRLAAYAQTNGQDGHLVRWEALPLSVAAGELRKVVADYRLDELVLGDELGPTSFGLVQAEVERRTRARARDFGVDVRSVRLGRLRLPEQVTRQHIEYWRALWQTRQRVSRANREAAVLEATAVARAEGEAILIQAIAEGLHRLKRSGSRVKAREIAAIRFIEALERVAQRSEEVTPLPDDLIPTLHELRRQLLTEGRAEDD